MGLHSVAGLPLRWAAHGALTCFKPARFVINHLLDCVCDAGTLPDCYNQWRHLDQLHLYSNSLTGTLPDAWSSMPIGDLELTNNSLTGEHSEG